jgi:hypothetical protein
VAERLFVETRTKILDVEIATAWYCAHVFFYQSLERNDFVLYIYSTYLFISSLTLVVVGRQVWHFKKITSTCFHKENLKIITMNFKVVDGFEFRLSYGNEGNIISKEIFYYFTL